MEAKKLYRKSTQSVIGGVCAGLGEYFNMDKVVVRLIWALAVVLGGFGVLAYLIAWIIIPDEPIISYH